MDVDEERDEEEEGAAGWLTTWADMMSVLLTFFIVLMNFVSDLLLALLDPRIKLEGG